MNEARIIDLTFIRRSYNKIKATLKLNNNYDEHYDFEKKPVL